MGTTAVPQTVNSPRARGNVRVGDWVTLTKDRVSGAKAGALGIVANIGHWSIVPVEQPDPKGLAKSITVKVDRYDSSANEAEIHLVDCGEGETHGETIGWFRNVPFGEFRRATLDEIRVCQRTAHVTPLMARRLGYNVTPEQQKTADEEEVAEKAEQEHATKIAVHPDAIALEAQIEAERQTFVASVEQRRSDLAKRL